jgi:hypothetical protein
MMPPQLARADRRRHRTPRPIVELLPHINIGDLCRWKVFPDDYYSQHKLEMPFRYPWVKNLVISRQTIEINHHLGYIQRIGILLALASCSGRSKMRGFYGPLPPPRVSTSATRSMAVVWRRPYCI